MVVVVVWWYCYIVVVVAASGESLTLYTLLFGIVKGEVAVN